MNPSFVGLFKKKNTVLGKQNGKKWAFTLSKGITINYKWENSDKYPNKHGKIRKHDKIQKNNKIFIN